MAEGGVELEKFSNRIPFMMAAEFDFHKTGVTGIGSDGFGLSLHAVDVDDLHRVTIA